MGVVVNALAADARNRAWRTFLQGLSIDVVVGAALAVSAYFATANTWDDIEWALLGFSVGKSVVQAGAAFVMRRWLDPSSFPTPLPPGEQPSPTDPGRTVVEWLLIVALALAVLALLLYLFDFNVDLRE